jgi:hypothetical protein
LTSRHFAWEEVIGVVICARNRARMLEEMVRSFSGFLRSVGGRDGNVPIRMQIDKYYKLGTLRQMIAESLAIQNRSEGNK